MSLINDYHVGYDVYTFDFISLKTLVYSRANERRIDGRLVYRYEALKYIYMTTPVIPQFSFCVRDLGLDSRSFRRSSSYKSFLSAKCLNSSSILV